MSPRASLALVFLLKLYIALIHGLLYIWFESFPIVLTGIYHFSWGKDGLAFVGILVGAFLVMYVPFPLPTLVVYPVADTSS